MNENGFVTSGELVSIRKITMDDTDLIVKWRNNEIVRSHFVYREVFTNEIHENWMRTKVESGQVAQYIICEKSRGNRPIGSVYYQFRSEDKKEAEYGIFIGESDAMSKGYGSETAKLAVAYARDVLGIKLLILRAFVDNTAAIRSYEKAGFVKTHDLPLVECSDGQKSDMILMENRLGE